MRIRRLRAYGSTPVAGCDTDAMHSAGSPYVRPVPASQALALAPAIFRCYNCVFGDQPGYDDWLTETFTRHVARDGFRLVVSTHDDIVIGFAWGYIGHRGQFWTDAVANALPPDVVSAWVDEHFEFVELGVLPQFRRSGIGQALHDRLLDGHAGVSLLSATDDVNDPAVRLYTQSGWRQIGLLRPGTQVMGRAGRSARPIG